MTFDILKCLLVLVSSRNLYSLRYSDASILSIRSYRRLCLTRSDLGYINRNTLRTLRRTVGNTNAYPKDPSDKAQSFFSPHSFIEKFTSFSRKPRFSQSDWSSFWKAYLHNFRDSRSKLCSTSLFIAFSRFYHTSLTFEPASLNVDRVLPLFSSWLGFSTFDTSYFPFLPSLVGHSSAFISLTSWRPTFTASPTISVVTVVLLRLSIMGTLAPHVENSLPFPFRF